MEAMPPPQIHCLAHNQDVLLKVSGSPREFTSFLKDISDSGGSWVIVSDESSAKSRTLLLRAPATIRYGAVAASLFNAKLRVMTTKVTFDRSGCD